MIRGEKVIFATCLWYTFAMAHKQKGYTIVEVLIFLAISGSMLAVAITSMSGQQQKMEFRHAMQDLEFRIRDMMSDVDKGFEAKPNNDTNYNCSGVPLSPNDVGCVFVGREINLCTSPMYIESRLAPFSKANYSDANAFLTLAASDVNNRQTFSAPGGVQLLRSTPAGYCRVAALNKVIGTSNQRVPRYTAAGVGDQWDTIGTTPVKFCFSDNGNVDKVAQITVSQSDIVLEVDKCD